MVKRRIEEFNDAMLLDGAKVGGIFKIKESFDENKKIDWFGKCFLSDYEWIETAWEDVRLDVTQVKYICKRTLITKHYVDWFLKIIKAFYETNKIDTTNLRLFESKTKECPVLIVYDEIGMVLAPRIDESDEYNFKNYIEEADKNTKSANADATNVCLTATESEIPSPKSPNGDFVKH